MKYVPGTFIIVPNKHRLEILSMQQLALYIWICWHLDEQGFCFPSISTLAKHLKMSERNVRRILQELISLNLVEKEDRIRKNGSQSSNRYNIVLSEEIEDTDTGVRGEGDTGVIPLTKQTKNENFPSENLAAEAAKLPPIPKIQAKGFGSPAINSVLANLKKVLKLEDFKDTNTEQRRWGHLFVGLIAKIGGSAFDKRLKLFSGDKFKWQNRGSMRYLYRELKLEPEVSEQDIEEAYHSRSSDLTFIKIYGEAIFCDLHSKFQDNLRSGI